MNLRRIADRVLLKTTKDLVLQERGLLVAVLYHLKEIDRRRLYCDLKYQSMREYAIGELKYPEDQADRRLAAMHVLAELPEIEAKIEAGALNLTNLCLAQVVFNKERKAGREMDISSKRAFVERLENVSTRQAQKIACDFCPEMTPKDLEKYQIEGLELRHKAEQLMRYHGLDNLSALLNKLFDEELGRLESAVPAAARLQRLVRRRDGNKCTNCGSIFKREVDHIIPKGAGGSDSFENLRVLCRACNQREAIRYYGVEKMSSFLRETLVPYQ